MSYIQREKQKSFRYGKKYGYIKGYKKGFKKAKTIGQRKLRHQNNDPYYRD